MSKFIISHCIYSVFDSLQNVFKSFDTLGLKSEVSPVVSLKGVSMTFRERRKKYLVCTLVILTGLGVWKVLKNSEGKVDR